MSSSQNSPTANKRKRFEHQTNDQDAKRISGSIVTVLYFKPVFGKKVGPKRWNKAKLFFPKTRDSSIAVKFHPVDPSNLATHVSLLNENRQMLFQIVFIDASQQICSIAAKNERELDTNTRQWAGKPWTLQGINSESVCSLQTSLSCEKMPGHVKLSKVSLKMTCGLGCWFGAFEHHVTISNMWNKASYNRAVSFSNSCHVGFLLRSLHAFRNHRQ